MRQGETVAGAAGVDVHWARLTDAHHALADVLDGTERARLASLTRPADRGRSLVAAHLLRVVVGQLLGVPPEDVRVDRTCRACGAPHGAPRVVGPRDEGQAVPWVSVSHSGLLVVVATSRSGVVGVDVQRAADLEPGADPTVWVRGEAELKARTHVGEAAAVEILPLRPPLGW